MKRLVKKIAGTTLALTMAVSGTALAADIDLTGMSLDELVELRSNITAEIDSRTNEGKETIPCGVYVAGTDIKEGSFKLSEDDDGSTYVVTFDDEESYKTAIANSDSKKATFQVFLRDGESTIVSLKEGNVLYIDDDELFIEPVTASWAPDGN